jgi:hypothetical protein
MEEAMTIDADISWLPHPWYHEESQPGSTPMPLSHCMVCVYCNGLDHTQVTCPDPYHLCNDCLSCIIPSYHINYGGQCPSDPCCHILEYLIESLSKAGDNGSYTVNGDY